MKRKGVFFLLMLFVAVVNSSCFKENGKKEYELEFKFSNGELVSTKGNIYEKPKKNYPDGDFNQFYKDNKKCIGFHKTGNNSANTFDGEFLALLTKEDKMISSENSSFVLYNSSLTGNSSTVLIGALHCIGDYKSPFRKFTVDSGTFTFEWSNAEDFGLQDTVLTGTWSLKRK